MWTAIIIGIASIISAIGGAALTSRSNRKIYEQQVEDSNEAYDKQLQDQIELTQDAREYNSESAQASRLLAAGKNPDLVDFSGSTLGSATAPTPVVPVQQTIDYGSVAQSVSNAITSTVGTLEQLQKLKNLKTEGSILESDNDSRILELANSFPELSKTFLQSLNKKSLEALILHGNKDLSKVGFEQFADQFIRYGKLSDSTRGAFFDYFNDFINSEEGQSYMIGLKNRNISANIDYQKSSNDPLYSSYGTVSKCAIDFMKASFDAMKEAEKEKFNRSNTFNRAIDFANSSQSDAPDPYYEYLGGQLKGAARAELTRSILLQKVDALFYKEIKNQNLTGVVFYMNLYNDLLHNSGGSNFAKTSIQSLFGTDGPMSKLINTFNNGMQGLGL